LHIFHNIAAFYKTHMHCMF